MFPVHSGNTYYILRFLLVLTTSYSLIIRLKLFTIEEDDIEHLVFRWQYNLKLEHNLCVDV